MKRLRLTWLAVGLVLGHLSILLSYMFLGSEYQGGSDQPAFALYDPGYSMLSAPTEEEQRIELAAEKLRSRGNHDHSYGVKMAVECGIQNFVFVAATEGQGIVKIPINSKSADGIQCLIERAQREHVFFLVQDKLS